MVLCGVLFVMIGALLVKMPERISAMEAQSKNDSDFYEFAELFSEIFTVIKSRYVEDVDNKQLFEGAINGMFSTLDDHSSYMPPDDQEMLTKDTEGEYSGVGMHITLDKNRVLTVISPIAGSPSARAGILPWDRIVEIDGQSTEGIGTFEAVKKLTGPTGSQVKLRIFREGESELLDFALTRQTIKVQSVFSKDMGEGIGYLRISKFQEDTSKEVRKALLKFNEENIRGVVVDLRNDPGGLLDQAVEICDFFLPKDQVIVSIKGRNESNNRTFYSLETPICTQSLIVLVNQGSASASEIFAGAMKDTGRGVIVGPEGSHTYGKGSVQTISELRHSLEKDANGDYRPSGIRLTTALYYTPSGISIHKKGIIPDIGIPLPKGHELSLMRHGLMGDPSVIAPEADAKASEDAKALIDGNGAKTKTPKDGAQPEATPEVTPTPAPTPAPSEGVTPSEGTGVQDQPTTGGMTTQDAINTYKEGADGFQDILLNEAIKYLKAFLIMEQHQAA